MLAVLISAAVVLAQADATHQVHPGPRSAELRNSKDKSLRQSPILWRDRPQREGLGPSSSTRQRPTR